MATTPHSLALLYSDQWKSREASELEREAFRTTVAALGPERFVSAVQAGPWPRFHPLARSAASGPRPYRVAGASPRMARASASAASRSRRRTW